MSSGAELWPLKPLLKMYKFNNLELYGCGGLVTTGAVAASLLFSSLLVREPSYAYVPIACPTIATRAPVIAAPAPRLVVEENYGPVEPYNYGYQTTDNSVICQQISSLSFINNF